MKSWKKKFIRLFAVVLVGFVSMSFVKSYIIKTKSLTEQFMVDPEAHLKVRNDYGPIEFINTDEQEARIEATLTVEGKTEEEIAKVLDQFVININVSGKVIDVFADINMKNWVQYNGWFYNKNTITFNDGSTALDIKDTDISLVVYLPKVKELTINNKYDTVKFESFNSDVNAQLMSSDISGGDINGNVDIDLKYGDMNVGDIQGGKLVLFDSDASFGGAGNLELRSKYSEIKFKDAKSLDQTSFDDVIDFENVEGDIIMNAKYSEISFNDYDTAAFDVFDCDLDAGTGKSLSFSSKYSTVTFKDVDVVELESFDDDFRFGVMKEIKILRSKYSEFLIDQVDTELKVISSFDDEITVVSVGENLSHLELDSKYTDLDFPIPNDVAYHLDAKLKYCSFDHPKPSNIETKFQEGSSLELICKINNPSQNSPTIDIKAFEGDITIQ